MTSIRTNIAGDRVSVSADINRYRADLERYQRGKIPDAIFLENRLRFGVYGQRQDGVHMMRSKLPLGLLSADQLEAFADIAERFGNGNAHLTTRQDIQTHFVKLDETPELMEVLGEHEMTAREACGNVVRNLTASPLAGVSANEAFDVTPYGMALARFLLRHPDAQSLGRKIKIHLGGDRDPRFNLSAFHDIGLTAVIRNGVRGFDMVVGGGLGPVPHQALPFGSFVSTPEVFPLCVAILRVFGKHGERKNRARARLKFLVANWGIERFRQAVAVERSLVADDPAWQAAVGDEVIAAATESPAFAGSTQFPEPRNIAEESWLRSNVLRQRQEGYATVAVRVPSGDLNPHQLRSLATAARRLAGEDTVRIGLDQSLYLRWIPFDRLLEVREALREINLGLPNAGGLGDTVTCPGADTCKLGITSPRALARSIQDHLDRLGTNARLARVRIHVSGCPNSCAQHQIADVGWFGATRSRDGVSSPHYMLVLGGQLGGVPETEQLGGGFGNIVTKIPAFRVGEATGELLRWYERESRPDESLGSCVRRKGFSEIKTLLAAYRELPSPEQTPSAYSEPGSSEPFAVKRGVGECAGEVVERSDFLLTDAEGQADLAVEILEDGGSPERIASHAHMAMELAARALLSTEHVNLLTREQVAIEFRERFYNRGRIFEGIGYYFLDAQDEVPAEVNGDRLRRLAVEAGLFVEEAHSIIGRLRGQTADKLVQLEKRL